MALSERSFLYEDTLIVSGPTISSDSRIEILARSPRNLRRNFLIGLSILLCLALVVMALVFTYILIPANVHYHITERYRFSTHDGETAIFLGVMVPKTGPYQTVKNLEITWDGVQEIEDHGFIDVVQFSGDIANGKAYQAVLEYDVDIPQAEVSWYGPVEDVDLIAQQGIERDNQAIVAQASIITDGFSGNDAFQIYKYTSDHLVYSLIDKETTSRSAVNAYRFGNCACAGFARLMIALCRASGIPSKFAVGSILPSLEFLGLTETYTSGFPGEAHAWVEYYSGNHWSMADPTLGSERLYALNFNRNDGRHLYYGEYNQLWEVYQALYAWASGQGRISEPDEDSFKFVFAATPGDASISSEIIVRKGWDGRWLNTLLVWGLTTLALCKLRNKLFPL
jgi:hypothetical protein